MKKCSKCGAIKPFDLFHKRADRKSNCSSRCKQCSREDAQQKRKNQDPEERERIRLNQRKRRELMAKSHFETPKTLTCSICKEEKPTDEFPKDIGKKFHRDSRCRVCMRARDAKRNARPEVQAHRKATTKKWQLHNKKRIRDNDNKRYTNNPGYAISCRISAVMNECLRNTPTRKQGRHWEDLVGYTLEELMEHLESLFQPGMTWENRGKWHIDHIIPRSAFDITSPDCEEFRRCWALNNLQPLWAWENESKRDKIEE